MNKERQQLIAKAETLISAARALLEQARDEESDYYENMPESLKGRERGREAEDATDKLSTAIDDLELLDLSDF